MRRYRPLFPAACIYPDAIFRINTRERTLFLTFDDGPNPGSTQKILSILSKRNVKAVFFCSGIQAEQYPHLVTSIRESGSITGNHGFSHLDGWKTKTREYISDVSRADPFTSSTLFRPPYGHLSPRQYKLLRKQYTICFWDLMPYDFDAGFGSQRSLDILRKKIRPGSVIVLHDTPGSTATGILEPFIVHAHREGYGFDIPRSGTKELDGS